MGKPAGGDEADVIHGEWHVRYAYSIGKVAGKFFDGLKQRKILATHCTKSGLSYLPPRAYCERSFEPCDDWVEAGHQGVIEAATGLSAGEYARAEPYYREGIKAAEACAALPGRRSPR